MPPAAVVQRYAAAKGLQHVRYHKLAVQCFVTAENCSDAVNIATPMALCCGKRRAARYHKLKVQ